MPEIEQQVQEQLNELQSNVRAILDLEGDIQEGKAAATGVADLKEQVNKIATRNSELIDEMKAAQEKQGEIRTELQERMDEMETRAKEMRGKQEQKKPAARRFAEMIHADVDTSQPLRAKNYHLKDEKHALRTLTNADAFAGQIITPDFDEDMIYVPRETPSVIDLITTFPTSSDTVIDRREQEHEGGVGPNVGSQAGQGATKPESDYRFESASWTVETVATWQQVSTQVLDDRARLEAEIRFLMERDLRLELDRQSLYGDENSNELAGMIPNSTAYDADLESVVGGNVTTLIDRIRVAMLQVRLANLNATAIILNPMDWASIELTKDGENRYIFVMPQDATAPRMWGIPVVDTTKLDADDLVVADTVQAVRLYDRQAPRVRISEEHGTNFTDNEATLLTEVRLAQAIRQSRGIVHYDADPA